MDTRAASAHRAVALAGTGSNARVGVNSAGRALVPEAESCIRGGGAERRHHNGRTQPGARVLNSCGFWNGSAQASKCSGWRRRAPGARLNGCSAWKLGEPPPPNRPQAKSQLNAFCNFSLFWGNVPGHSAPGFRAQDVGFNKSTLNPKPQNRAQFLMPSAPGRGRGYIGAPAEPTKSGDRPAAAAPPARARRTPPPHGAPGFRTTRGRPPSPPPPWRPAGPVLPLWGARRGARGEGGPGMAVW